MSTSNKSSLVVKLEGGSTIGANTLINMLTHYVVIAERANDLIGEGEYKSEVKVKALKEGSFEISFEIACTWLQSLMTRENVDYASNVVAGIVSAVQLYKWCKGKKVKPEEAQEAIPNQDEPTHERSMKLYSDHVIREQIRQSIETAQNDANVGGITLIHDGKPGATIDEGEFADLVIPPSEPSPGEQVITDGKALLSIISLSFNRGDHWRFIYQGNRISTRLSDDGLQKEIDRGTSFAKGDALEVELEIVQKWSNEYKTYVNDRYKVVNVLRHIHSPRPQDLFPDTEQ